MIISKRKPKIETEAIDWAAVYDDQIHHHLAAGLDAEQADLRAFATCEMLWLLQNPLHGDYLAMGNRGICCFCGRKGADMPLQILGTGVFAHSGPGRPGNFPLEAKRSPNCWDATVWQLSAMARAGLAAEGLRVGWDASRLE
jgi:hypothetical protein